MKEYLGSQIRNVALLGHMGCGKTSLAESMLFLGKGIAKKGEVERKEIELELIDVMKEISPSKITYMDIVSPLHSEMAILFNDENTYPMSIKEADAYINGYEKYENSEKCPSYILKELKQRRYMKSVLEEGRRDEFLLHLEQRKQKTIKWLQKMGIPV